MSALTGYASCNRQEKLSQDSPQCPALDLFPGSLLKKLLRDLKMSNSVIMPLATGSPETISTTGADPISFSAIRSAALRIVSPT